MIITVYSQPRCEHCEMAKNYLDACGFAYEEVNIRTNPAALAFMKQCGHTQTPQIYVGDSLLADGNQGLQALSREEIASRIDELTD